MIGTNLCVWLNVLVQETKHEIAGLMSLEHGGGHGHGHSSAITGHDSGHSPYMSNHSMTNHSSSSYYGKYSIILLFNIIVFAKCNVRSRVCFSSLK